MGDLGTLLAGIGAMLGGLASVLALLVTVRRGSDRENRRSATAALEVAHDDHNVTPIERGERDGT